MKYVFAILLSLFAATPAIAAPPDALANPVLEARARALQKELRCLVCQGESLDESNAPLAADLRQLIREHIRAGESDDQIKAFLAARYGDFVLLNPPIRPDTFLLWFGPALLLLIGASAVVLTITRARRRARRASNMNNM